MERLRMTVKRITKWLCATTLLAAMSSMSASTDPGARTNGELVLKRCSAAIAYFDHKEKADMYDVGWCLGFVKGIGNGYLYGVSSLSKSVKQQYCPPKDLTVGQEVRTIVDFLQKNPQQQQRSGSALALVSLLKAYPCAGADAQTQQGSPMFKDLEPNGSEAVPPANDMQPPPAPQGAPTAPANGMQPPPAPQDAPVPPANDAPPPSGPPLVPQVGGDVTPAPEPSAPSDNPADNITPPAPPSALPPSDSGRKSPRISTPPANVSSVSAPAVPAKPQGQRMAPPLGHDVPPAQQPLSSATLNGARAQ